MRPIKFRAWDESRKEMLEVTKLVLGSIWYVEEDGKLLHFPLMQFTGLHDKNGKEIYEGDIVVADYRKSPKSTGIPSLRKVIKWNEFAHAIGFNLGRSKTEKINIRIIGNIYENPELLKQSNPDTSSEHSQ